MAIETKEKVIGNSTYKINTYATGKSLGFMVRLTKVFGESIPAFFSGIAKPESDVDLSKDQVTAKQNSKFFDAMQSAVGLLVANLDKDDVPKLIEEMVKAAQTQKDGQLVSYESDFSGASISDLLQVMYFIIEENYGKAFIEGVIKG